MLNLWATIRDKDKKPYDNKLSGIWRDMIQTIVEVQQKAALPMNDLTETIFYDKRMIIDSALYNQDAEPRAFLISKVNRINPKGILIITAAQKKFDQHLDYIERDESGKVIGMWAGYYESNIEPTSVIYNNEESSENDDQSEEPIITSTLSCSGKPQIKIGGSSKTITARFYSDSEEIEAPENGFIFTIDGEDAATLLSIEALSESAVKIKFLGNDTYIGKILSIKNVSDEIVSTLDIEIVPL